MATRVDEFLTNRTTICSNCCSVVFSNDFVATSVTAPGETFTSEPTEDTIRTDCWKWDTGDCSTALVGHSGPIGQRVFFYIAITMLSGAIEPAISIRRRD